MDSPLIHERFARLQGPDGDAHAVEIGRAARALGRPVVVVSACLCGEKIRWDGDDRESAGALAAASGAELLPLCPEILGGLGCPRPRLALSSPEGGGGLGGAAALPASGPDEPGRDCTAALVLGATRARTLATLAGATRAVLKQGSPSCGTRETHVLSAPTGPFSLRVAGRGVAAAALSAAGLSLEDEGA